MEQKLIEALKTALDIEDKEIDLADKFKEFEEWDSLSRLSLISELDEAFEVQLEGKEFDSIETVGDLLLAVKLKM
ncbi:MAG: acyl carrier protein [Chitinophagaceae bacterium]|jgi:acyl carrier protein|nr:acyl carrier protein [Chitinophagaceae bacterium]MCU0383128.1 acyl carrier protein [Cyclobacteriaceae bacterium]